MNRREILTFAAATGSASILFVSSAAARGESDDERSDAGDETSNGDADDGTSNDDAGDASAAAVDDDERSETVALTVELY
ncbi:hypothetical protein [Halopenitus sp. POP-27]|uniref:hypothetical protein n=1 Tax=Halopenitus sp. POP-27 TaxID=2994425 RepID=UPI00246939EB|nr:hypothetical protein [Halopenitus sp. POP-27]